MRYLSRQALLGSVLTLSVWLAKGDGPYLILGNSRPKCVTVEAPRGTTLLVQYDMPDMMVISNEDPVKGKDQDGNELGLDWRYDRAYKQKVEAMRRQGLTMRDMSIVIQPKGETIRETRESHRNRDSAKEDYRLFGSGTGRLRRELEDKEGVIEYDTGFRDGLVEICIQSLSAAQKNPSRFSLQVDQKVTKPEKDESKELESRQKAKKNLSRMEQDLIKLSQKVELILSNADFAKEQEVSFHDQSLAMNKASQWWPIFHLVVLITTGVVQANHIIRFFKSRHIY